MREVDSGWQAFWPEDGETADDACPLKCYAHDRIYDAESAAVAACRVDFSERDGWERSLESRFRVVVIAPDGTETPFQCWHAQSVDHHAALDEEPAHV